MKESIAYVPRALLRDHLWLGHGFWADPDHRAYPRLAEELSFDVRADLEEDPSRKQLIPYVVLGSQGFVWTMTRTSGGTESRLHGRVSLGVGGHLERHDVGDDPLWAGMMRELHEELVLPAEHPRPIYRGLINDDETPVGQVHLGVVFSLELPRPEASIREVDKLHGAWWERAQLVEARERMETWSAFLLDHIPGWFDE